MASTLQHCESRVTLIQMTNFRFYTKRIQQPPSSYTQQHFLLEPQLRPASVKLAGNPAMSWVIRGVIAVE
jgi:hypothetical protein